MDASTIIDRLPSYFDKALASGDLHFFPSKLQWIEESGLRFGIRLCPALRQKPTLDSQTGMTPPSGKRLDPFSPPYTPNLYLGELRDEEDGVEYVILLNRYSIVPQHFLMVTKEYESQSSPLLPPDLAQTYSLLSAAQKAGKRFFAIYNCGNNSGASQPHKHIQFIPMDDEPPPTERLAKAVKLESPDKPFSLTSLPYANHVFRFPPYLSTESASQLGQTLSQAFLFLLDLVISTARHDPDYPAGTPSYNVVMTLEHMHLIPRWTESYVLCETGDKVDVNAMGFAGMLLAKSEEELEAMKNEQIGKILRGVGLESVHDLQVAGSSLEATET